MISMHSALNDMCTCSFLKHWHRDKQKLDIVKPLIKCHGACQLYIYNGLIHADVLFPLSFSSSAKNVCFKNQQDCCRYFPYTLYI